MTKERNIYKISRKKYLQVTKKYDIKLANSAKIVINA